MVNEIITVHNGEVTNITINVSGYVERILHCTIVKISEYRYTYHHRV